MPSTPFDELAADYDVSFTSTVLGKWLRSIVWDRINACISGCRRVLEIGCGTGEDAIHLARLGHRVCATDVSMPMLKVAREKAVQAGCEERIEFHCISMEQLADKFDAQSFDATVSNFGAVNCASRLDYAVASIAPLLSPNSPLLWVIMGRHVPWEWAWFLARLEKDKAFRRLRKGGTNWRGTQISYPTPRELTRILSPHFAVTHQSALGLLLPPSYAAGWLERWPRLFKALTHVERMAYRCQPLAALADHYIIEARRLPTDSDA